MPAPTPVRLSKSKFIAGIQCLKRLYFEIHQPELADKLEEGHAARLEEGNEVGILAQQGFPGGVFVDFDHGIREALTKTAALLDDPSVPAIFEATFQNSNLLVRVDVLQRQPHNRWQLIEVKSSTEVKPYHVHDVAIQNHVLCACGLDVSSACLMHLNRDYRYDGTHYDPEKLFTIQNLTQQVMDLNAELPELLKAQRKALEQATPPDILPGSQCAEPYRCEFYNHCNAKLPPQHISFLPRLSGNKQQELVDLGVTLIQEIPESFPLTPLQARVVASVRTGQVWVNQTLLQDLSQLEDPLCFMDFESLNPAIPRFPGMWPYFQIPFQWSVHRQAAPRISAADKLDQ